jgi:hypothetical protein
MPVPVLRFIKTDDDSGSGNKTGSHADESGEHLNRVTDQGEIVGPRKAS